MTMQLPLQLGPRPSLQLDDYLPGPNGQAISALEDMLQPGGIEQLYLSGPPGTGKTHLLVGLCELAESRGISSVYLPLRECGQWQPALLEGLEAMDLIAIDDVQSIAAQADWEAALFALYNRARDLGRRLLISAEQGPAKLPIELPDLRSRLGWGTAYHLQPLADEDKGRLLQREAARRGLTLSEEVSSYILRHCPRHTPALLQLLDRLDHAALAAQRRLTLPFVRGQISTGLSPRDEIATVPRKLADSDT